MNFFFFFLILIISANSQELTCPHPTKLDRSGKWLKVQARIQGDIPCDLKTNGGWCGLPGRAYPWPTIRRFVQENQGLMRRMYGEQRQLNLMRLEIDNSIDYESPRSMEEEEQTTTVPTKENEQNIEDVTSVFFEENDLTSTENFSDIKSNQSQETKEDLTIEIKAKSTTFQETKEKRRTVNACPIKEEVVAPYWANNTRGEILALLNLHPFEQYVHWEKCNHEHKQMYCREGCRCTQQYRLHRLLAFDPTNECRGIFSDWFRFPSCCVCKCYLTEEEIETHLDVSRVGRVLEYDDEPDVSGVDSHFFYSEGLSRPR